MSNNAPEGWLVILGDAHIGETLIARSSAVVDADGINYSTTSFQWLRDGKAIPGATSQSYDVTSADLGGAISVQYIYTDNRGNKEVVTSKAEPPVPAFVYVDTTPYTAPDRTEGRYESPNNIDPTGWMIILGDAEVGETLIGRPNTIADANGIKPGTEKYQWFREDKPIPGATSQTYKVTTADQGTRITVEYSYTDGSGTQEFLYAKPKDAVPYLNGSGPIPPVTPVVPDVPDVIDPPKTPSFDIPKGPTLDQPIIAPIIPQVPDGHINSGPVGGVFILGFPIEGTELLARIDALFDRDHIIEGTGEYQWLRDGEPIAGATGRTYTITAEDRGAGLSVQYSYLDGGGTREVVVSDEEPPVPDPNAEPGPQKAVNPPTTQQTDGEPSVDNSNVVVTPEDDVVPITGGLSPIDALAGSDTAQLPGDQDDYTVTLSPNGVTVTDRNADGIGTVELTNFEFLDFGTDLPVFGGPMNLEQFGGHAGLDPAAFSSFVELYIAYFNRAPDAIGLGFWGTAYANGTPLQDIAGMFADQPETLAAYPADTSNIKFVSDVYENVLGRVPDIEGLRFWTDALNDGSVGRGDFIFQVLGGVKAAPPADATQEFIDRQQADQAFLEAKTDLGTLFAVHRGMSNVEDAAMVMEMFDGSPASLDTAVEAVETLYAAAQDPVNGEFLMPLVGVVDNPFEV